ncbi:MAG: ParB/RepB/Spo0J family partition protein [Candidatus Bipolaricaulota bacterium]|nr:ParB/RepB/Spo0J family partition protein [Candidatus Bipolaricaulota bacterium]MDW8127135.1 ParB/RepB/Spo0J family partition protein [Candidatus Bipolaricaulota bacterium]
MPGKYRWTNLLGRLFFLAKKEPALLLPFDWVKEKVEIKGWRYLGLQEVEVEKIAGSVDRYDDFNRAFLPVHGEDARQKRIEAALRRGEILPPVKLYKLGDAYFVVDGHHRVAAARKTGAKFIDAEVLEFLSDVPISPADTEKDILLKAEYTAFLRHTRLKELCPDAEIILTELSGYRKLLEHIDVHRYFRGIEEKREIPYEEAVVSWYQRVYRPIVEAVRKTRILRKFPGRTEADLYVWLSEHLYYLAKERGVAPDLEQTAREFAEKYGAKLRG